MLSRCLATLSCALFLATAASALEVRDSRNALVGQVIDYEVNPTVDPYQATVIAKHGTTPYLLYAGRQGVAATDFLYYATADCTGTPGIALNPAYRYDMMAHPSGEDPAGNFWIMHRITMSKVSVQSHWRSGGGYHGDDPASCEPITGEVWLTPVTNIGALNTRFRLPLLLR